MKTRKFMLKIGVLGAGHLGKIHIKCIKELKQYELVGFYDPDERTATDASQKLGVKKFSDMNELFDAVDVVDIVTPTLSHYTCASAAIRKSKHVFIEKPITNTIEEAKSLMSLSREADVKVQVGHVERFNPAFISAKVLAQRCCWNAEKHKRSRVVQGISIDPQESLGWRDVGGWVFRSNSWR